MSDGLKILLGALGGADSSLCCSSGASREEGWATA